MDFMGSAIEMEQGYRQEARANAALALDAQRIALARSQEDRMIIDQQRRITQEQNSQTAYQTAATGLMQIDPDTPQAAQEVLAWKSFAGKHLDGNQMRELFDPIEGAIDVNQRTFGELRAKSGIRDPIIGQDGRYDWDATFDAAQKNLDELKVRTESWSDDGRFLYHNLRDKSGFGEYEAMSIANQSEEARRLIDGAQAAAKELGLPLLIEKDDMERMRRTIMPSSSYGAGVMPPAGAVGSGVDFVNAPGMGSYVYDLDEVKNWLAGKVDPNIIKAQTDKAKFNADAQATWMAGQQANATESAARANYYNAQADKTRATAANTVVPGVDPLAEDGGQPKRGNLPFEPGP
jgi:hypothetical protein